MFDNSQFVTTRDRWVDPSTANARLDGGIEAARTLLVIAVLTIAARLFYLYASAHRIAVTHNLLGFIDASGRVDLNGQPDGGASLVAQSHDADALVTIASVTSLIVLVLFVLALVSLARRRKRGDEFAAAINKNRAVRIGSRFYLLATLASIVLRYAFSPSPNALPVDLLRTVRNGDNVTIGLQIVVIAAFLIVALAINREIGKARAAARIG